MRVLVATFAVPVHGNGDPGNGLCRCRYCFVTAPELALASLIATVPCGGHAERPQEACSPRYLAVQRATWTAPRNKGHQVGGQGNAWERCYVGTEYSYRCKVACKTGLSNNDVHAAALYFPLFAWYCTACTQSQVYGDFHLDLA